MFDRSAIKYLLKDNRKAVLIFYSVIVLVLTCGLVLNLFLRYRVGVTASYDFVFSISGLELSSIIFLLVTGLCSFRQSFRMLMQNGYSRKAIWANAGVTSVILAAFMATIDSVFGLIATAAMNVQDGVQYNTILELLYPESFSGMQMPLKLLLSILFLTMSYLSTFLLGYIIAIMYYRMNKALKITISISVPVLLLWVMPIVDAALLNGIITKTILHTISFLIGRSGGEYPLIAIASSFCIVIISSAFSYLLSRKAVLKD